MGSRRSRGSGIGDGTCVSYGPVHRHDVLSIVFSGIGEIRRQDGQGRQAEGDAAVERSVVAGEPRERWLRVFDVQGLVAF
jgi:hypothetical protein